VNKVVRPTMNSIVNMLLQHCSTVTTWNNMVDNLFQVDINRREQGCAATMNSIVNMLLQHCSTVTTWNNMVDNLFIVGRTTLFTLVDINLEQPVRF
jgi:nicotinamide mononucleotide adenylyltransferase